MTAARRRHERDAVRLAAAIRGCNCRPDIRHRKPRKGIQHIDVAHDETCPAADTGSQLMLARGHQSPHEFAGIVAAVMRVVEEGR